MRLRPSEQGHRPASRLSHGWEGSSLWKAISKAGGWGGGSETTGDAQELK